jgi:hypothetical protein
MEVVAERETNAANPGCNVECLRSSETSEERYKGGDLVLHDE